MKFRTKYIRDIGWFGQVKRNFFCKWETIGKHTNGFGLYPEWHVCHPLDSEHAAIERCKLYEQYKYKIDQPAVYRDC